MEQKEINAIFCIAFVIIFTIVWWAKPEWFEHLKDD